MLKVTHNQAVVLMDALSQFLDNSADPELHPETALRDAWKAELAADMLQQVEIIVATND